MYKHIRELLLCGGVVTALALASQLAPQPSLARNGEADVEMSATTTQCVVCHEALGAAPGVTKQWQASAHARAGVGCEACHGAAADEPDAYEHHLGLIITTIPSPLDCAKCHQKECDEFENSRHSKAATYIQAIAGEGGRDAFLAYEVEGKPAAVLGCEKCHGTQVRVIDKESGKLHYQDWPNDGIGRVNPDGSKGSCSACHTRHVFSVAEARQPETCGTCHMGPDHPQYEIYMESKHGVRYAKEKPSVDWDGPTETWNDHLLFPVCVTCHMGAVSGVAATHDVSSRLAWRLETKRSEKVDAWEEKRTRMIQVCTACHSTDWANNYFQQFDEAVEHYNKLYDEYHAIYKGLADDGLITYEGFDESLDFEYFEFWHHEGRRARMGASMMGWDFVQWHGFYELVRGLAELKEAEAELREKAGD